MFSVLELPFCVMNTTI